MSLFLELAVKSTLILGVFGVILFSSRRASASIRYGLWRLAFGGLLLLPLFALKLPAVAIEPPVVAPTLPMAEAEPTAIRADSPRSVATAAPAAAAPPAQPSPPFPWEAVATGIWAFVASGLLLRDLVGYLGIRAIARRGDRLEFPDRVRVVRSGEIDVPMTFGLFRATILLPRAANGWSRERIETVLLHESAHIERGDWLWIVLSRLACALYWPNPLVWGAARRMREEMEISADDLVLGKGVSPARYAEDLVEIAHALRDRRYPAAALPAVERATLRTRVREILHATKSRQGPTTRAALGAAVVAILAIAACSAVRVAESGNGTAKPIQTLADGRHLTLVAITEMDGDKARSWDAGGALLPQSWPVSDQTRRRLGFPEPPTAGNGKVRRYLLFRTDWEGDQTFAIHVPGEAEPIYPTMYQGPEGEHGFELPGTVGGGSLMVASIDVSSEKETRLRVVVPPADWKPVASVDYRDGQILRATDDAFRPSFTPRPDARIVFRLPRELEDQGKMVRVKKGAGVLLQQRLATDAMGEQSLYMPDRARPADIDRIELAAGPEAEAVFEGIPLQPRPGAKYRTPRLEIGEIDESSEGRLTLPDGSTLEIDGLWDREKPGQAGWRFDGAPLGADRKPRHDLGNDPAIKIGPDRRPVIVQLRRRLEPGTKNESHMGRYGALFDETGIAVSDLTQYYSHEPSGMTESSVVLFDRSRRTASLLFQVTIGRHETDRVVRIGQEAKILPAPTGPGFGGNLSVSVPKELLEVKGRDLRFVPVDGNDDPVKGLGSTSFNAEPGVVTFALDAASIPQVKAVRIQSRPLRWVRFTNVSLYPR